MKNALRVTALVAMLAVTAAGETYRVGPGEEVTKISAIADRLEAGDVVEVTGDIADSMVLRKSGTVEKPIIVRGADGKRPKIDFGGARNGIETRGDHYVFESLAFHNGGNRGIFHQSHDITVRDCYFENNHNGILGADSENTGDIRIEYCEFNGNGNGFYGHQIYLASWKPGAQSIVQFNWFHDSIGGVNIKTRMPRNVIRYNWIEAASNYECDLVDSDQGPENIRPMHLLFLGNVVVTNNDGNPHHQLNVASDQPRSPGTQNTYLFVGNTFVCNRETDEIHMIRVGGDPADVGFYDNIFVGPRVKEFGVMSIQSVEPEEGPAGTPGRVKRLHGAGNFVAANGKAIPPELKDTVRAADAMFVDFEANDLALEPGSPCIGGATGASWLAARYLPPMRRKMAPGDEEARPIAEKGDLGAVGATVKDAKDAADWMRATVDAEGAKAVSAESTETR